MQLKVEGPPFSRPVRERTWRRVESPEAARLLTDLSELRFLTPFLGRERTVSEAAEGLGVRLDELYFRVRRAERLGLLAVARREPRVGRAVKRYRSSADGFFVPLGLTPFESCAALVLGLDLALERRLIESIIRAGREPHDPAAVGLRVYRDERGELAADVAHGLEEPVDFLHPASPATLTLWPHLDLDFEDAKELQRELEALWRRYAGKKGAQRYLLRLALAPLLEPGGHRRP